MQQEPQGAPSRVDWHADHATGHAAIDAQHQGLLAQCQLLADLCEAGAEPRFDAAFLQLKALVQAHFETEATLLAAGDEAELEDHRAECEEFGYLADEIATTDNFDRLELQRFAAIWCLGHVTASARQVRARAAG